jgi:hypothetical protein
MAFPDNYEPISEAEFDKMIAAELQYPQTYRFILAATLSNGKITYQELS